MIASIISCHNYGTVLFSLKLIKPSLLEKTISYRKLKSIDLNSLQSDLTATDLCRNPPEVLEDLPGLSKRDLVCLGSMRRLRRLNVKEEGLKRDGEELD